MAIVIAIPIVAGGVSAWKIATGAGIAYFGGKYATDEEFRETVDELPGATGRLGDRIGDLFTRRENSENSDPNQVWENNTTAVSVASSEPPHNNHDCEHGHGNPLSRAGESFSAEMIEQRIEKKLGQELSPEFFRDAGNAEDFLTAAKDIIGEHDCSEGVIASIAATYGANVISES